MKNRSNNLNNLYVIESPLQALCALEVSLSKAEENHSIIVRLSEDSRKKNNQQILDIVKLRAWDTTFVLKPITSKNLVLVNLWRLVQLSKIRKMFRSKVDSLYLGEFRYEFMHMVRSIINAPNTYLIDDGAATVEVIKKYIKNRRYHPDLDSFFPNNTSKKLIYKIIYSKYLNKKVLKNKINVLTAFAEKDSIHGIEELKFNNIRRLYEGDKETNNLVYFYGSKYSEASIVSLSYELTFLTLIKNFYKNIDLHIVYFPHRDESEEKLEFLENKLGFIVKRSQEIAELQLLKSNTLPMEIAGAYTSTLNNLKCIYPELRVTSFKLDMNQIGENYRQSIANIYQYYNSLGISIESFN